MVALTPFVSGLAAPPPVGPDTSTPVAEVTGGESKATLVAAAKARGLSARGSKSEIVARLRQHAADQRVETGERSSTVTAEVLSGDDVADLDEVGEAEPAEVSEPSDIDHED